ncbi:hypothetical protein P7K49_013439 [Saguinus oedipus]|uniref:Uncharacterized protein n=1 Tax=Saguinus oedipus TaxID=9490 RepID=A0ABQ9VFY6_SAGOE|nr:hypothetical protein P7K49_013439 [Saguinus oedipus]
MMKDADAKSCGREEPLCHSPLLILWASPEKLTVMPGMRHSLQLSAVTLMANDTFYSGLFIVGLRFPDEGSTIQTPRAPADREYWHPCPLALILVTLRDFRAVISGSAKAINFPALHPELLLCEGFKVPSKLLTSSRKAWA